MIFYQVGIGQSHDFCQAYNLFVTEVASFTLKRCGGANDAMRDTNKLPGYMPDKSNVIIIIIFPFQLEVSNCFIMWIGVSLSVFKPKTLPTYPKL